MGEQTLNRMKKIVGILLAVFFIATLTAVSASACDNEDKCGDEDHTSISCGDHDGSCDDHCGNSYDNYDDCDDDECDDDECDDDEYDDEEYEDYR